MVQEHVRLSPSPVRSLLGTLGAVVACLAASPAWADGYVLGAGDTVRIDVFGEPELSREILVTSECEIEVGLIGRVQACGRTTQELANDVRTRLGDGYLNSPVVSVDIKEYGSQKVEVRGQVKNPGIQVLTGPTTLSEIVTKAGGPSEVNVISVQLIRNDGTTKSYPIAESNGVVVDAGDIVVLPKGATVFVTGQVKTIGGVPFTDGLRVTQAITLAGGATDYASDRVWVIHSDGNREAINLRRINLGLESDVVLQPDDKVEVKRSVF